MVNKANSRSFLNYIHYFRGFTILLIIANHLVYPLESDHPVLFRVMGMITGNSSVLFFFIAGFLFKHLLDSYQFRVYMRKKFLYVLMPYLILSIPALILYVLELPYAQYNLEAVFPAFEKRSLIFRLFILIVTGAHQWHFWFIPVIFLIYLTAPLMRLLDRFPKFYILLPFLFILAAFIGRTYFEPLKSFVYFLPVYILGMYI